MWTGLFWPSLWIRAIACKSVDGFQSLSKSTSREALHCQSLTYTAPCQFSPDQVQTCTTGLGTEQEDKRVFTPAFIELVNEVLSCLLCCRSIKSEVWELGPGEHLLYDIEGTRPIGYDNDFLGSRPVDLLEHPLEDGHLACIDVSPSYTCRGKVRTTGGGI